MIDFPTQVAPGEEVKLRVASLPLTGKGVAHVQVRDKSQRDAIFESTVAVKDGKADLALTVPSSAGPDIGSIRAVVFDATRITYLRRVFQIAK